MLRTDARAFPPYQLLARDYVRDGEDKLRKLERIYHVAHAHAWDGRKVLAELIARHGGVHLDEPTRQASGRVFSIILWGELAAWNIAADLALRLPDPEVKMAATSQAFDEARHFYVLRDYLVAAGATPPPLDGFSLAILRGLLATDDTLRKLVGMQLLVENIALTLFRLVGARSREPVLAELMPYFERDEARHVGLGVLYLPRVLPTLSRAELRRLQHFQTRTILMSLAQGFRLHDDFVRLGIDQREMNEYWFRLQRDVFERIRDQHDAGAWRVARVGLLPLDERVLQAELDFLYPRDEAAITPLHRAARGGLRRGLDVVEAVLRRAA